jgi:hypothetical protein
MRLRQVVQIGDACHHCRVQIIVGDGSAADLHGMLAENIHDLRNMFRRGTYRVPFGTQLVLPAFLLVLLQHRSLVSACRHESAMRCPATSGHIVYLQLQSPGEWLAECSSCFKDPFGP